MPEQCADPAEPNLGGRPSIYSEEMLTRIVAAIMAGRSMVSITGETGMPSATTCARWMRDNPEFNEAVTAARRAFADELVRRALAAASNNREDFVVTEKGLALDKTAIQRSKLIVDTCLRIAARLDPQSWAEPKAAVAAPAALPGPIDPAAPNAPVQLRSLREGDAPLLGPITAWRQGAR